MTIRKTSLQRIQNLLYPIIGEIKTKSYFSRYDGLFKHNTLFALHQNGKLYFKFSFEHLAEIQALEESEPLRDENLRIKTEQYYLIPSRILENLHQYIHWFNEIIHKKPTPKVKYIRHLPNMNISLERLLSRYGIKTVNELRYLGEINTFVKLIIGGADVNAEFLFKLYGALHHKIVYTLNEKQKLMLLKEADNALYESGLRKRFVKQYSTK